MNISAVNNNYSLCHKSQANTYSQPIDNTNTYSTYLEDENESKSGNLGLIALGILAAAGVGYGLYTKKDVSSKLKELTENKTALKEAKTALEEAKTKITKLEEAKTTLEEAKTGLEKAKEKVEEKVSNLTKEIDSLKDTKSKKSKKSKKHKKKKTETPEKTTEQNSLEKKSFFQKIKDWWNGKCQFKDA